MKSRSVIGYALAFLGVSLVLCTVAYHFWVDYAASVAGARAVHEFMWIPLVTGAILGWFGFFWVDPSRAVKGGDFLLTARERIERVRITPLEGTAADRRVDPAARPDVPAPRVDQGEGSEEGVTHG